MLWIEDKTRVHLSAVCSCVVRTDSWSFRPNQAMSKDNRPQLSAVPSPRSEQHLCRAKTIWTAAINGPDKLQLFSCFS